jgi:hypothetical protein
MKINPDGSFFLVEGDLIPYICPTCNMPTEYEEGLVMVKCSHCGYLDETSNFTGTIELK